jgi:hypothetical protein
MSARTPGIDRSLYEMAVLAELRNSLRSGDVWVPGSRQFKDFEDYLLPQAQFAAAASTGSTIVGLPALLERPLVELVQQLANGAVQIGQREELAMP